MTALDEVQSVVVRADGVPGPAQGCWTYDDYAAIPEDGRRYEVVDGVLYMTPAPNLGHQGSVVNFVAILRQYVQIGGLGRVYVSPVDVELALHTVVQPDAVVVLKEHQSILIPSRVRGAPDLVVEVASPSTATYDRRQKMDAYAAAGVHEYWLADPYAHTVEVLYLENGVYVSAGAFAGGATLPSRVLPGFPALVEEFFA